MKTLFVLLALSATVVVAEADSPKTVDMVYIIPNGFTGPIFIAQGRLALSDVSEKHRNTYTVVVVDNDGEAVQVGSFDKVSGWSYRTTVVQRNGLKTKLGGEKGVTDDDVAFRGIGGYGAWKRVYRPGGFAAYFIGTKSKADEFRDQLEQLVKKTRRREGNPSAADKK